MPNSPPPVLSYAPPPPQMSRPPPAKPMDLDLTIVSAKHLKNVNWRGGGDLKPYAVFWVDPDRRLATKSDDSGSTRPVWNERFSLSLSSSPADSFLTLEIFHSKPSDTPKPLVGTLRISLRDLPDPEDHTHLRTFTLSRPSGRPQGKIRLKLALRDRPHPPNYHVGPPPPPSYFYSPAAPPPPPPPAARDYTGYSPPPPPPPPYASSPQSPYGYGSYPPDAYSSGAGYYPSYYSSAPPPPRPFFGTGGGSTGPSAPVDYSPYDQGRPKGGKLGLGAGLAVGAIAGGLGGLAIEEGLKYEEEKIAGRVEGDLAARDDYSDHHFTDY